MIEYINIVYKKFEFLSDIIFRVKISSILEKTDGTEKIFNLYIFFECVNLENRL